MIDSGSSASFLSTSVAQWLSAVSLLPAPTQVQVAGGGIIQSPEILHDIQWTFDQYSFRSNFRLLPLTAYDVIIAMDWLEAHSPMHVHWLQKWLAIPYQGQLVLLQGLDSVSPSHLYIQLCAVQDATPQEQQAVDVPPEIQLLHRSFPLCLKNLLSCLRPRHVIIVFLRFRALSPFSLVHIGTRPV